MKAAKTEGFAMNVKWLAGLLWVLPGCGAAPNETGPEESATASEALGTLGGSVQNVHLSTHASETSISTMHPNNLYMTMSFNDKDSAHVTYNNNSRQVSAGTSMMGWTTIDANGNIIAQGRVPPPSGWSVLWGDPAVTRNRSVPNSLYIAQLAVPSSKFPSGGIIGPVTLPDTDNRCGSYVGGACIARSTNGGTSFSLSSSDCVRRITTLAADGHDCPNGVFYDGSDMETSPEGRVYAAFDDATRGRIDVYMATSSTGSFARITDPTPADGSVTAGGHPRLKWGPGGLYLLYASGVNLKIMRYGGGSSRTGSWTAPVTLTALYDRSDVVLSDRTVRVGPEYAFDVGKAEDGTDAIRVAFQWLATDGKHHIRVYQCTTASTITCRNVSSVWDTAGFGASDQFHPAIAAGARFSDGSPIWMMTYHDRSVAPSGNKTQLSRSVPALNGFVAQMDRVTQETAQVPCPDTRGYWGDYDNMHVGAFGVFYRGFSDSSHGTCTRAQFNATPQYAAMTMTGFF